MFLWCSFTLNLPHLPHLKTQASSGEKQMNKTNYSSLSRSVFGKAHRAFSLVCRLLAWVWLFLPGLEIGYICSSWHIALPDALRLPKDIFCPAKELDLLTWGQAFLSFTSAQCIESLPCCALIPFNVNVIPPPLRQSRMKPQAHYSAVFRLSLDHF